MSSKLKKSVSWDDQEVFASSCPTLLLEAGDCDCFEGSSMAPPPRPVLKAMHESSSDEENEIREDTENSSMSAGQVDMMLSSLSSSSQLDEEERANWHAVCKVAGGSLADEYLSGEESSVSSGSYKTGNNGSVKSASTMTTAVSSLTASDVSDNELNTAPVAATNRKPPLSPPSWSASRTVTRQPVLRRRAKRGGKRSPQQKIRDRDDRSQPSFYPVKHLVIKEEDNGVWLREQERYERDAQTQAPDEGPHRILDSHDALSIASSISSLSLSTILQQLAASNSLKACADAARSWNRLGNDCFRSGDYSRALQAYEQAIYQYVQVDDMSEGELVDAIILEESEEASMSDTVQALVDSYSNMGTIYWTLGRIDEAVAMLTSALDILNNNSDSASSGGGLQDATERIRYQMGLALMLQGSLDEAKEQLKACLAVQKQRVGGGLDRELDMARVMDAMGKVEMLRGDSTCSLQYFCAGVELKQRLLQKQYDPTKIQNSIMTSWRNIAKLYLEQGTNLEATVFAHQQLLAAQKHAATGSHENQLLEIGDTLVVLGALHGRLQDHSRMRAAYEEAALSFHAGGVAPHDERLVAFQQLLTTQNSVI